MLKLIPVAFFSAIFAAHAAVDYPSRPSEQSIDAHDPAVIKDGRKYYIYGTHNMPVWESRDLVEFEQMERRLIEDAPAEARAHVGGDANDMWAPDIVEVGKEFRLYYCLSIFGTSQSYIGFLTGRSPTGRFEDNVGVTSSTDPTEEPGWPNALDPCVLTDESGRQWMVYGSFFGGIYILQLDDDGTARRHGVGERIADRSGSALEGPYAIYNPKLKQYFLFVSYDKLDSTYNVRVGRSKGPDGPYEDINGRNMAGREDNLPKILNSYAFENHSGWHGPGHNSVLRDGDNWFMVHHARVEVGGKKRVRTHVRKMVFTDEGWPVVSPERYAGEEEQAIPEKALEGTWEYLPIDPNNNELQRAWTGLVFEKDNVLKFNGEEGKWQLNQPNSLRFKLKGGSLVSAKVMPAWDWENDRPTVVFTGLDKEGIAVWGKKQDSSK